MAGGLTGNLDQWPLPELLNMLGSSRQSGRVVVEHESLAGAVFLQEGQLVHAATATEAGVQALTTLFGMHEGSKISSSFENISIIPSILRQSV